jgi:hypothetical protein
MSGSIRAGNPRMVTDLSIVLSSRVAEIANVTIVTSTDNQQIFGVFDRESYDAAGRTATC